MSLPPALSLRLERRVYCKPAGLVPGDGVPSGSGVQGGPGRLSACPGEAVDHLPEGTAQLLSAGRLALLLQPLARHERHHPHAGTRRHPGPLLHAPQQARRYTSHRLKGERPGLSLQLSCPSLAASPGLRCVCSTCSSSLESLRAGLRSRNPQSLFGPLCQMKRCLNPGIVMQSIAEAQLWDDSHQHLSHTVVYSIYLPPSRFSKALSIMQQFHDYSANILSLSATTELLWLCLFSSLWTSHLPLHPFLQAGGLCGAGIQI